MNNTENNTDDKLLLLESTRFWIQRVFIPILACIGFSGNVITVIILTRKRMRSSTNIYLTALAIADIVFLLCAFYLTFTKWEHIGEARYEMYWRFFGLGQWLINAASNTSVWLTVSFTIERYIAVCHPIKGKAFCTENRAKCVIVIVTLLCIITTVSTAFEFVLDMNDKCLKYCIHPNESTALGRSQAESLRRNSSIHFISDRNIVLSNVPNSDEENRLIHDIYRNIHPDISELLPVNCSSHPHIIYINVEPSVMRKTNIINERHSVYDNSTSLDESTESYYDNETGTHLYLNKGDNISCCLKTVKITMNDTEFGANETYKAIRNWYYTIFSALLPFIVITTFNGFLIKAVYQSQANRRTLTNRRTTASMSNENRITIMLISVVCLFLICQTPSAAMLIYENIYGQPKDAKSKHIMLILGNIFNFLVTVNDALNFVMYCVLSQKYRDTFKLFFCTRKRPQRQDTLVLSLTSSGSRSERSHIANNYGFRQNVTGGRATTPRNLEERQLTPASSSINKEAHLKQSEQQTNDLRDDIMKNSNNYKPNIPI